MLPSEVARRLHAQNQARDASAESEWLRFAETRSDFFNLHRAPEDPTVTTPATLYPTLFGPSGRWPLPATEEAATEDDSRAALQARLDAAEARVAASQERRAALASSGGA